MGIKVSKRWLLIFISFIILLVVFLFIIILLEYSSAKCTNTDSGWSCEFGWTDFLVGKTYQKKCELSGGWWKCHGWCHPQYTHYCDFPFEDSKKRCINSQECQGECLIKIQDLKKCSPSQNGFLLSCSGIAGECSQYPVRSCEREEGLKLNDGKVFPGYTLCD